MSRTRLETLENLRVHNIEPEEDDFTKFSQSTQDKLIRTFKKFPNITSRYKWIDKRIL